MLRLPPLDHETLDAEQRRVVEAILDGPRGVVSGPYDAWLHRPELADRARAVGDYVRFECELPRDLSELAILLTARRWRAQFEFWAHARLAREAGLAEDVIEAVSTGREPTFAGGDGRDARRVVYELVTEYFRTNRVSDPTCERAMRVLGEQYLIDLVAVVGYYAMVSMMLNVFEVPMPPGVAEPLEGEWA